MKKNPFNIIPVLFFLSSFSAYSQINCTVPLSPVLTYVSVQPETGNTEFNWTLSPSTGIAAYIIYSYKDGTGMVIDTLWDPSATSYTYISPASKYFSVSYVVAAHRMPNCTSPLSNVLSTIYCSSEIDTCNKKLIIKWNKYPDYPKHVQEYKILVSENGSPLSETYSAGRDADSYTISDFTTGATYCFVVRAVLDDGSSSSSNKSCLLTDMQRPPQWINADYASVNSENGVSLSFTVDPLSDIKLFSLERKINGTGTFQEIARLTSVDGSVTFTDNQADVNLVNYYRLSAVNSCNIPVTFSNICSNIVLSLDRTGNDLDLSWNSYKTWLGIISSYHLFVNTGSGFNERRSIQSGDTSITLGYQEIMYEVSGDNVCFYITASEISNPYEINGESQSNTICSIPTEVVTVPNVFTPNNDLVNDFFRPVLTFTPLEYHLVITDRQGKILFETKEFLEEWDGSRDANAQPQGVYLWFLKAVTPSGKTITKTGTVTIITK